jgi:hypothetical protein
VHGKPLQLAKLKPRHEEVAPGEQKAKREAEESGVTNVGSDQDATSSTRGHDGEHSEFRLASTSDFTSVLARYFCSQAKSGLSRRTSRMNVEEALPTRDTHCSI